MISLSRMRRQGKICARYEGERPSQAPPGPEKPVRRSSTNRLVSHLFASSRNGLRILKFASWSRMPGVDFLPTSTASRPRTKPGELGVTDTSTSSL